VSGPWADAPERINTRTLHRRVIDMSLSIAEMSISLIRNVSLSSRGVMDKRPASLSPRRRSPGPAGAPAPLPFLNPPSRLTSPDPCLPSRLDP